MAKIRTLLWDVGGVILSNAWDAESRKKAIQEYYLEEEEFNERHELVDGEFEEGRLTLEEYLDWVVFYRRRDFSREDFREFMFFQSEAKPEALAVLAALARSGRYRVATLNNESRELNLYRIEKFRLGDYFQDFFSSCFLGLRKPRREIYRRALEITQTPLDECVFIDDRKLNVECAQLLGITTVHFRNAEQLTKDLAHFGVEV
jgi:putative hydrolase of the HAD superfamily